MKLKRIVNKEISLVGGVASGIAYAFGFPVWAVRVAIVLLTVIFSIYVFPFILYVLAWMFLPKLYVTKAEFLVRTQGVNSTNNDDIETVNFKEVKTPENESSQEK